MNILIHLYLETYLLKKPKRQILKEKLKKLSNIAHRRNRVDDIVDYDKEKKKVKQMIQMDKKRIGFTPEKGQNQWTRSCQNSGTDKRRQPQQFTSNIDLLEKGFKLDKTSGVYEKKEKIETTGKKKKEVIIKAVGLDNMDGPGGEGGKIFYSCNPKDNGEHMFVGFLSRSANPYGRCMPCCFKKDPMISKNKQKREYFMKCIGKIDKVEKKEQKIIGDRLYILQDTNKIQEGRFGFLPKYLDFYLNRSLDRTRKIKHHYLLSAKDGYFFKYGTSQTNFQFLNAIASIYNLSIDELKDKLIKILENDKSDMIFTSLNNGDIRTSFSLRKNYINFIKTNNYLDFELFNHILSMPGVLSQNGTNIIVFKKLSVTVKKTLEKEKIRDDFIIRCQNSEETDNLKDNERENIFIIQENKNFYPIVMIQKKDDTTKKVDITKKFKYNDKKENIINHILEFYLRNCESDIFRNMKYKKVSLSAKKIYKIINTLNNKDFIPKYQIIDARNKCKYLITNNSTIIPTKPSGSIYNIQILKYIENKYLNIKNTISNLDKLYKLVNERIPLKPIGLYYDTKTNTNAKIIGIMTESYDVIPIKEETINISWANKQGLVLENKQLFDKIDEQINKGQDNFKIDERIKKVNYETFMEESYNLFRLEFSEYMNILDNENLKNRLVRIINHKKLEKSQKLIEIRKLLYKLIDPSLLKKYEFINQKGGKYNKFVHIVKNLPNLDEYLVKNNRDVCNIHNTRNQCFENKNCHWAYDNCYLLLTQKMAVEFVNKISVELVNNKLKASELLKKENYFVSDIVDYNKFTERTGQTVIISTNHSIYKVLNDIFGKENVPTIGKRRGFKVDQVDIEQMNIDNPIKNMGELYIQNIIDNNLTIYRAFGNSFYWIKQKYYDLESRNLGYYNTLQTNLANYFKSIVTDWLLDKDNEKTIKDQIISYIEVGKTKDIIEEFVKMSGWNSNTITNGIIELFVLNKIYNIPIIIYNDDNNIIYIFDNGLVFDNITKKDNIDNKKYSKYKDKKLIKNSINIKFSLLGGSNIPLDIEVIYYK
jgi:hypothetical protein